MQRACIATLTAGDSEGEARGTPIPCSVLVALNTLSPGAVETPIIDGQFATKEEADGLRAMFVQMTPLGRIGRPEEIASAALFLASDDSSFSTGIDLVADGGVTQV